VISLHAWPGGLAVAIQGDAHRAVLVFGPDGWRRSEPKLVFPDGPPPGTESATLPVPEWLADQLAQLELSLGGVHTDFIRIDRLLSRLHRQSANAAVLVLGTKPAIAVLTDGRLQVLEPPVPTGVSPMPILAGASGWIIVFSGRVSVPAASQQPPARPVETAVEAPQHAQEPVQAQEREQMPEPAPGAVEPEPTTAELHPAAEALDPVVAAQELTVPHEQVQTAEPAMPAEPEPVRSATPPSEPVRATDAVRPAAPAAAAAEERFVVSSNIAAAIPDDIAAEISGVAGAAALSVVPRLDGSQTVAEIAASTGLGRDQVSAVVRLLVARKLAFRYVSRVRPATGAKARR
jgi:hypothetical protein